MPSTNGHGPKRAILYARVSTDEQAKTGYSLAQQLEALRAYCEREGYEGLEEVQDPGQSGASLERPGMDRVRNLVAAGGVSVVLAQDRDRFAREPAYLYLLKREFEEYGTKIRALNDRGDDSPEGALTDGILDQLAKYERLKIAERSKRGIIRKAREGKIVGGGHPNYGFVFNETRDGYVVDGSKITVAREIFESLAAGETPYSIVERFEARGIPSPGGRKEWNVIVLRRIAFNDVYKPHTTAELEPLLSPEVHARLDPEASYGVWWYNRRRKTTKPVVELVGGDRCYRKRTKERIRGSEEWIAVPVPDAGVKREHVEAARARFEEGKRKPSRAAQRFWELSGGLIRCSECGSSLTPFTSIYKGRSYFYYTCRKRYHNGGPRDCPNRKSFKAADTESDVWGAVSSALLDPETLARDLQEFIERVKQARPGDPDADLKAFGEELEKIERRRGGFLDLAADGLMDRDELRTKLAELEERRRALRREMDALAARKERLEELERNKEELLEYYAAMAPTSLAELSGEERRRVYETLRLCVQAHSDGALEVTGALGKELCTNEHPPRRGSWRKPG
jgi:site-specific DNA recombinase